MNTSFIKKFKSFDFFGLGVNFLIEGNNKTQSVFGATVSFLCAFLVGAYALYQFQLMALYNNTSITYLLNKNAFD